MQRRWQWLAAVLATTLAVVLAHRTTVPAPVARRAAPRSPTIAPARPVPVPTLGATTDRAAIPASPARSETARIERSAALADGTRLTVRAHRAGAGLDAPVELEMQLDDGSGRPVVSEGERLSVLATQGDRAWRGGVFEDADRPGRYWTHLALPDAAPGTLELGVAVQPAGAPGAQGGVSLTLSLEP